MPFNLPGHHLGLTRADARKTSVPLSVRTGQEDSLVPGYPAIPYRPRRPRESPLYTLVDQSSLPATVSVFQAAPAAATSAAALAATREISG